MSNIKDAFYPLVQVPFKGEPVFVKLKILTNMQIMSCGDFSLIETFADKIAKKSNKKISMKEIVNYSERQYRILKESLVSPTYDEIIAMFSDHDISEKRKQLEELSEELIKMTPGPKRSALEEEIDSLRVWLDFILPEDFVSYIVSYALEVDKTDIKKVTEEALLEAAILGEKYKKRPSEIICSDGVFSEFNKLDVDRRAILILEEYRKEHNAG